MAERQTRSIKARKEGANSSSAEFRSQYDKAAQSVLTQGKEGSAGWFGRQKYGASDYNGVKSFSTKQFQTKSFASSDDQNWMGKQAFNERSKTPAFADQQFGTKLSPFANDTSNIAGKKSKMGDQVFKTTMNRMGTKSQEKTEKVEIIVMPEQTKDPAYSEAQVKKLLGR